MSSSYNFKDNLTIDNNKYLKWLDITGTSRSNIISLDNSNNVKINSAFGDLLLNSGSNNSFTFLNANGNSSGVIVGSRIGIGFNTTTNINSILTLNKNNFIGINTSSGSNDGYLGLAGSSSLNTSGSRIILYGNEVDGKLNLYSGNTSNGTINLFTGDDKMRFQILNNGTAQFLPDGVTSRLIINNTSSTFTNDVILSSGMNVSGNVTINGSLTLTTSSIGNLNFNSSNPSTSYSSGAVVLTGGMGISNTVNSSSVTAGGGLSIAGGAAIGKDVYVGGKLNILNSTVATSSENASVVLYGGLGVNSNILLRSNSNSQIKLSPVTEQNETSISFYSKNNFASTSNTGSSWTLGQNVNSVSSGNFAISNSQFGNVLSATYSGKISMLGNVYIDSQTLKVPKGTTAERPVSAEQGFIRYNSDTDEFEGYGTGSTWGSLGGGGGGGSATTAGNIIANSINLGVSNMFSGSFTPSNNISVASNVTGLSFNNSDIRSFIINLTASITRTIGGNLYESFTLEGNQKDSSWELLVSSMGDISGFNFTITSLGQIQYTSTNITNYSNSILRYNVNEITNTGTYDRSGLETQGTLITNTMQILNTQDVNIGVNNGALYVAGGITIAKSLYVSSGTANISNITSTNISVGTISVSTLLSATGNSNTIGNIFTTGGNVGIGTSNPTTTLDILNPTGNSNLPFISLGNRVGGAGNQVGIILSPYTGRSGASSQISAMDDGNASAHMIFSTAPTGNTTTIAERMRITNSGNVGIGTTSPGSILHVAGAAGSLPFIPSGNGVHMGIDTNSNSGIQLNSGSNGSNNYEYIDFGYNGVETVARIIHNNANRSLLFQVNSGTSAMQLNSTGSVSITGPSGVGTNGALLITGGDANTHSLYVSGAASQKRIGFGHTGTIGNIFAYDYGGGGAQNLALQLPGGNVGIGTASPGSKLHVDGGGLFASNNTITQQGLHLQWNRSNGGGESWIINQLGGGTSASIRFGKSNTSNVVTEQMRITESGNVGIGTSSPVYKLDVNGSIICSDWFRSSGATGWFNQTYSKGIYANDATWVRTYPDRSAFLCGTLNCNDITTNDNAIGMGSGTINFTNNGAGLNWGSNFSQIYDDGDLRIKTDDNMRLFCGGSEVITLTPSITVINTRTYINNYASGNVIPLGVYAPNIGGYQPWVVTLLGKTESTNYGVAVQGYYYAGSGSTSNYYFIGFNGKSYDTESFKVYPGGSIAKTGGTFDIIHPTKNDPKKRLIHSFIEGPRCDLIYRGTVQLENGTATVNIDSDCVCKPESAMTQGTFEALVTNTDIFLQNKSSFDQIIGNISGNILTIVSNNTASNAMISWMVIGERKDSFIKQWNRTNSDGYLVTEYIQE
jgi:hypothetical protein